MNCSLSRELRKKHGRRSFPVRKNDIVRVMGGSFKGKTGKVNNVNLKKLKLSIEGIQRQKKDGTKVNLYFFPSKLQITELNLDDKKRLKSINKNKITTGEKNAP